MSLEAALPPIGLTTAQKQRAHSSMSQSSLSSSAVRSAGRSNSATPVLEADEHQGYKSFAVFCEVKLQEVKRQSQRGVGDGNGASTSDRKLADLCFQLLHKAADVSSTLGRPLRAIANGLEDVVYSDRSDDNNLHVGPVRDTAHRKPHFAVVADLQAEIELLRLNHAKLEGAGTVRQLNGKQAPQATKNTDSANTGRESKMVDSRLIHLEAEMRSLFDRLQDSEKRMKDLKRQLEEKTKLARDLHESNASLKFEADSMYRDMQRAEAARDKAEKEVEQLIFDQAELGFLPKHKAGKHEGTGISAVGQVGPAQALAECKEKLAAAERERDRMSNEVAASRQERARLAFRISELKKLLLVMVPREEMDKAAELAAADALSKLEANKVEMAANIEKTQAAEAKAKELSDLMPFMTPRPDWSNFDDYLGEIEGIRTAPEPDEEGNLPTPRGDSSREHVEALMERIDLLKRKLPKPKGSRRGMMSPKPSPAKSLDSPTKAVPMTPVPPATPVRAVPSAPEASAAESATRSGPVTAMLMCCGPAWKADGMLDKLHNSATSQTSDSVRLDILSQPDWLRWIKECEDDASKALQDRNFTRSEVVNLILEIEQMKKRFDSKVNKQTSLSDYLTIYLREKFGTDGLRAEVGYNLALSSYRLAATALDSGGVEGDLITQFWRCLDGQVDSLDQFQSAATATAATIASSNVAKVEEAVGRGLFPTLAKK